MKLPVTFRSLGDPITIERGDVPVGALGCWDPSTGTIKIGKGQTAIEELIVLIHESLHFAEDQMKQSGTISRRVDHGFIHGAAFGVATILIHAGAVDGVTVKDWKRFVRRERRAAGAKREQGHARRTR